MGVPAVKLVHHVTEVLRLDHGQQRHGIIRGSGLEPDRQHPLSVEPIGTSFKFQSKGFPFAKSYASTSLVTIAWSRNAAAHSSIALLVRMVCCVRSRPELLDVAGVELDLLRLGDPDNADVRDSSASFSPRPLLHVLQLGLSSSQAF